MRAHTVETDVLCDKICSFKGVHSLLAVFRSKDMTRELKVVVALAMAYLLPSFVHSDTVDLPSLAIGLKIAECLRFLFSSEPIATKRVVISRAA